MVSSTQRSTRTDNRQFGAPKKTLFRLTDSIQIRTRRKKARILFSQWILRSIIHHLTAQIKTWTWSKRAANRPKWIKALSTHSSVRRWTRCTKSWRDSLKAVMGLSIRGSTLRRHWQVDLWIEYRGSTVVRVRRLILWRIRTIWWALLARRWVKWMLKKWEIKFTRASLPYR